MKDEQFLREVYEGSYRRLVTAMYAVSGDMGVAEDIVQEAFVRALARIRDFRHVDNPEAWLRRVALNIHHSRWRRMQKLSSLYRKEADSARRQQTATDIETDHVVLIEALRQLPSAQREVIAMHHFLDLSVSEIAATLGVADGTVKSRMSRGRESLAAALGSTEGATHA